MSSSQTELGQFCKRKKKKKKAKNIKSKVCKDDEDLSQKTPTGGKYLYNKQMSSSNLLH